MTERSEAAGLLGLLPFDIVQIVFAGLKPDDLLAIGCCCVALHAREKTTLKGAGWWRWVGAIIRSHARNRTLPRRVAPYLEGWGCLVRHTQPLCGRKAEYDSLDRKQSSVSK